MDLVIPKELSKIVDMYDEELLALIASMLRQSAQVGPIVVYLVDKLAASQANVEREMGGFKKALNTEY